MRKPWDEAEILDRLRNGELRLPPAELRLVEYDRLTPPGAKRGEARPDGILEVAWQGRLRRFVFEYKPLSTPKTIETAVAQATHFAEETELLPMIIVPFLSTESLWYLQRKNVSGIDLSGNGAIFAPEFSIWQQGKPNRFKDSQPIKNIYRGNSSLLARCFLLRAEFPSLNELRTFSQERLTREDEDRPTASTLTKGTASKVVQALEEELIVTKEQKRLRLVDPQRLLTQLRTNYRPSTGTRLEGKTALSSREIWQRLKEANAQNKVRYAATGEGSATRYGVLSGSEKLSLYVTNLDTVSKLLEVKSTRVFPNIELIEEKGDVVYFDTRREGEARWASPIQTWLELASGGPRERDAAALLENDLLQGQAEKLL